MEKETKIEIEATLDKDQTRQETAKDTPEQNQVSIETYKIKCNLVHEYGYGNQFAIRCWIHV